QRGLPVQLHAEAGEAGPLLGVRHGLAEADELAVQRRGPLPFPLPQLLGCRRDTGDDVLVLARRAHGPSSSDGTMTTSGWVCCARSNSRPRPGRGDHVTNMPGTNGCTSEPWTSRATHAPRSSGEAPIMSSAFSRAGLRHQPSTCTPVSGPKWMTLRSASVPARSSAVSAASAA